MFPDFQYLLDYLLGVNLPALSLLKTFGFLVALSFITAAMVMKNELKRYADEGKFQGVPVSQKINVPITTKDYVVNGIIGFLVGYKLIGLLMAGTAASSDPMSYLLSGQGNLLGGIALAALFLYLKRSDALKIKDKKETTITTTLFPHHYVADLILIAAVSGFAGAKIFNAFESWDVFIKDPIGNLFSGSGLTFYGGLIMATIALYFYARKKKFSFAKLCDALAPALILAYGIGRLGCQFAGDGDWGIYNSAYLTQADGTLIQVAPGEFEMYTAENPHLFIEFNGKIPHKYQPAPSGLPTWLFAQNYPHNVNREGFKIQGYEGNYPMVLPAGVFPTPVYEFFACLLIFAFLMAIRKKLKLPLQLFGVYLIFNGIERFLVEKIRVNSKYDLGFIQPTQAEIISFVFIVLGLYLWLLNPYKKKLEVVA